MYWSHQALWWGIKCLPMHVYPNNLYIYLAWYTAGRGCCLPLAPPSLFLVLSSWTFDNKSYWASSYIQWFMLYNSADFSIPVCRATVKCSCRNINVNFWWSLPVAPSPGALFLNIWKQRVIEHLHAPSDLCCTEIIQLTWLYASLQGNSGSRGRCCRLCSSPHCSYTYLHFVTSPQLPRLCRNILDLNLKYIMAEYVWAGIKKCITKHYILHIVLCKLCCQSVWYNEIRYINFECVDNKPAF